MKRGAAECDKALKEDPKNAEAMVWRGAIRVFQAGQRFGKNNPVQAFPLWTSRLKGHFTVGSVEIPKLLHLFSFFFRKIVNYGLTAASLSTHARYFFTCHLISGPCLVHGPICSAGRSDTYSIRFRKCVLV